MKVCIMCDMVGRWAQSVNNGNPVTINGQGAPVQVLVQVHEKNLRSVSQMDWRSPQNFLCTIFQIGPSLTCRWSLLMTAEGQQFSLPPLGVVRS